MSPHLHRPHPCRIFASEPHYRLHLSQPVVQPPAGTALALELAVVECERFRDPPSSRGRHGERSFTRNQVEAPPEAPDLHVAKAHAGHRIRLRPDHRAGNLLDPACTGRCDPARPQPAGNGVSTPGGIERRDRRGVQGIAADAAGRVEIDRRQRIEQLRGLPAERRGARDTPPHAGPPRFEHGNHAAAQQHSREALVIVGRILDYRQPGLARVGTQCRAGDAAYRPRDDSLAQAPFGRDPGQTARPGSAQQVQQDRLDMVVLGVGGAQHVPACEGAFERPVANGARRSFVGACGVTFLDMSVQHRELHGQPAADLHAVARPSRRIRVQVVVDVDGVQIRGMPLLARRGERVEQRKRVGAAAEGDDETGPGRISGREPRDGLRSKRRGVEPIHAGSPDQ